MTESSNPLEELGDSDPENYILVKDAFFDSYKVYYRPLKRMVVFVDCHDLELRIIDYLLAHGVRIEEDIENLPYD